MTDARPAFRGDGPPGEFQEVLRTFKRDGCNLLVTGEVVPRVTERATRKLLGSPTVERRRVLVVVGSRDGPTERLLPGGVRPDDDRLRVVDHRGGRSAAAMPADPSAVTDADDVDLLADAVERAVEGLAAVGGDFEPSELRLSVTSLPALLDPYGPGEVAGFLEVVCELVAVHGGMGHYHLPVSDDSPVVSAFAAHVDARIELRQEAGTIAEQRWHVPGYGTTEWVTL